MFLKSALLLVLLAAFPNRSEAATLEYQVKAGYLFNFLKFVEWPWTKLGLDPEKSLRVAVLGKDPFEGLLSSFEKEKVWGRNIAVEYRESIDNLEDYQMIFFSKDFGVAATADLLAKIKGKPILTVGEGKRFLREGGLISLIFRGQTVSFLVHLSRAKSAGLYIDSQLLNLAQDVIQ